MGCSHNSMSHSLPSSWSFFLLTFGCKVNQYETEVIREAWTRLRGQESPDARSASLICINSCAITAKGERDARSALYRMRRQNPEAVIVLTGCAARLFPLQKGKMQAFPDIIIDQSEKARLLEENWLAHILQGEKPSPEIVPKASPLFSISQYNRARPILKVQDGCTHRCTYCIVPQMRSTPYSRPPSDILSEAESLFSKGYSELVISGINLKQYGIDRPEYGTLIDLLAFLDRSLACEFPNARLRLSSVEPSELTPKALDFFSSSSLLVPHLHLSLQHASQDILRRMGRGHYTCENLARQIEAISSFWPVFGLGADIIVGFPGESREDHEKLLDFCHAMPFTYAHVFPYSPRPRTPAASFPDHVPHPLKMERAEEARMLFHKKKRLFYERLLREKVSLSVVPDDLARDSRKYVRGISEYYATCLLEHGRPESPHALLKVTPKELLEEGLLVVPEGSKSEKDMPGSTERRPS